MKKNADSKSETPKQRHDNKELKHYGVNHYTKTLFPLDAPRRS